MFKVWQVLAPSDQGISRAKQEKSVGNSSEDPGSNLEIELDKISTPI
jgi:hypothetical protein